MITDTDVVRKMVWDIVPCDRVRDFMPSLGLIPGSDEVNEMEHRASHVRLTRLAPVAARLTDHSEKASQVVTSVMLRGDINNEDQNLVDHVVQQNAQAIYTAACAILAQLLDDGVLSMGPR